MSQKPLSYETLKSQVNTLASPSTIINESDTKMSYADYAKPPYVFAAVPVVISIVLYASKPFFIMDDVPSKHPGQSPVKVLSYKKLAIFSIVISCLIVGTYYYYYGRQVKKSD
jgi:hypothetical protein